MTALPPPPRAAAGPAPARRTDSVRRTSSIDIYWPEGQGGPSRIAARARDALTARGGLRVLDQAQFDGALDSERRITALGPDPRLGALVGERPGGQLRKAIAAALPGEVRDGTALHLLLDDLSGANLVSSWAWSQWDEGWHERVSRAKREAGADRTFARENVCSGLQTGSSGLGLSADGVDAGALADPADREGWHEFPAFEGCAFRRARRIDAWHNGAIHIDAHFQDSATTPQGERAAVHEYRVRAMADAATLELLSLEAEPRVLPFPECPAAAANAERLIGTPLPELRQQVLAKLRGTVGCTHLNDALRALADAPVLAAHLADATVH